MDLADVKHETKITSLKGFPFENFLGTEWLGWGMPLRSDEKGPIQVLTLWVNPMQWRSYTARSSISTTFHLLDHGRIRFSDQP